MLCRALFALLLFVAPALVASWALSRRSTVPFAVRVLDFGTALGLDLLFTLTLTWVFPLGVSVWLSRAVYLVVAVALYWSPGLGRGTASKPGFAFVFCLFSVTALTLSTTWRLSYDLVIWDRDWHIGIASLLRTSRLPFENFYLPRAWLRYHFLGDVIASNLQSLSGDHLHSALAFSVAHDLFLSLTGLVLVALVTVGASSVWGFTTTKPSVSSVFWLVAAPLFSLAVIFAGPMTLHNVPFSQVFTTTDSAKLCGRTFLGYTTLAYRPHVVVAGFFIAQSFLALALRVKPANDGLYLRRTITALCTSAAALALLDEASAVLLPVGLGCAWIFAPESIHPRRWRALSVVVLTAVIVPFTSVFFGASLSPGGPAQRTAIVPLRHLQLFDPVVTWTDHRAWLSIFLVDYFPFYSVAILVLSLALWERRRELFAVGVFFTTISLASFVAATKIEVNGHPSEGHRFLTAAMVLSPLVSAWALASARKGLVIRLGLFAVMLLTAASGYAWQRSFLAERFANGRTPRERSWAGPVELYSLDCAAWTGPLSSGPAPLEHVDPTVAMPYAGCRPVRLAGRPGEWSITVVGPANGADAARQYRSGDTVDPPTALVCPVDSPMSLECLWARRELQCAPVADRHLVRCPLPRARLEDFYSQLR